MSNHNGHESTPGDDRREQEPAQPRGGRKNYGAMLMLVGFGALIALMVVMQKRMAG